MINVYVYLPGTMADWETGYLLAELNSRRYFKKDAPELSLKTVSALKESVKSMGGIKMTPDSILEEIVKDDKTVLVLPGADTWSHPENQKVLEKAKEIIAAGGLVCGICGATVAMAEAGLLNNVPHTSNGPGFLEMFSKNYTGSSFYKDEPATDSGHIITGGSAFPLEWARLIIQHLDVFNGETLEAWYEYFSKGTSESFYRLMQSVQ